MVIQRNKQRLRTAALAADAELEVEMRRTGSAGVAAVGDVLSRRNLISEGDVVPDVVAVRVAQPVRMLDRDAHPTGVALCGWV